MKRTACMLIPLIALVSTALAEPAAQAAPSAMTRQEILDLAVSGVDYSYWWGHGSWRMDGSQTGSCSGSCPSCSHSGSYGADCSAYVAKAWQVPGPSDVTVDNPPYTTANFRWESTHWSQIPRGDAVAGDAFVYRNSSNTGGHIVLYESGDPWGSSWVYEARGCSYGIVRRLKSISSSYVAIRRDALEESTCDAVPATGRIVDQDEPCFELGGPSQYWRTEQAGWDGSLKWTHATNTQVYNYAIWHLDLEQAGRYRLEAYTPAAWAESQQANYQVRHGGVTTSTVVDQTAVDGWVTVGEFDFAAGDGQWVRLEDLTGEPGSSNTRVVFDAIRLTPADPVQTPTCERVPPEGRTIDQTEECFEAGGPAQYWRTETDGWGGSLLWTHAVATQAYNYGVWQLDLEQAGHYRLEAYTAAPWAESQQARYQVRHDGTTTTFEVDQTAGTGWTEIGVVELAAGGDQWVRLEDLTGEPGSSDTRVVFDAIRLTPDTPSQPPICEPVPPTGRVIDNGELCFELGGPAQYWRTEQAGWGGSLRWTHATSSTAYNFALWRLSFLHAGRYRIEAYTAAPWAESRQARYQVHHDGTTTTFQVDQTAADGWTTVGEVDFAVGGDQWVRLEDLTGESNSSNTRVVADALRITWVDQGTPYRSDMGEKDRDGLIKATGGCNTSNTPPSAALCSLLLLLWVIRRARR